MRRVFSRAPRAGALGSTGGRAVVLPARRRGGALHLRTAKDRPAHGRAPLRAYLYAAGSARAPADPRRRGRTGGAAQAAPAARADLARPDPRAVPPDLGDNLSVCRGTHIRSVITRTPHYESFAMSGTGYSLWTHVSVAQYTRALFFGAFRGALSPGALLGRLREPSDARADDDGGPFSPQRPVARPATSASSSTVRAPPGAV